MANSVLCGTATCLNGGTCSTTGATCNCLSVYTGNNCEIYTGYDRSLNLIVPLGTAVPILIFICLSWIYYVYTRAYYFRRLNNIDNKNSSHTDGSLKADETSDYDRTSYPFEMNNFAEKYHGRDVTNSGFVTINDNKIPSSTFRIDDSNNMFLISKQDIDDILINKNFSNHTGMTNEGADFDGLDDLDNTIFEEYTN
jgi:hypothetical protein